MSGSYEPYDFGTLYDWYITSVDDSDPVWTEAHIEELLNDFYVIPKEEDVPIDIIQVVRCRNCKFYNTSYGNHSVCTRTKEHISMNDTDYCSYGERRVNNEKKI